MGACNVRATGWCLYGFMLLRIHMCSAPDQLWSFQKWYEGREADLVSCWTAHSFSCSLCWRGLCHIQLSKCTRQQSLLVMRALGRDGFLTSSPEIVPTRHEEEVCGDALLCRNSPWIIQSPFQSCHSGLMGRSLSGCCQLSQHCCLHESLFACSFGPLELHAYQKGCHTNDQTLMPNISAWGVQYLPHKGDREDNFHHMYSVCWHFIVKLAAHTVWVFGDDKPLKVQPFVWYVHMAVVCVCSQGGTLPLLLMLSLSKLTVCNLWTDLHKGVMVETLIIQHPFVLVQTMQ